MVTTHVKGFVNDRTHVKGFVHDSRLTFSIIKGFGFSSLELKALGSTPLAFQPHKRVQVLYFLLELEKSWFLLLTRQRLLDISSLIKGSSPLFSFKSTRSCSSYYSARYINNTCATLGIKGLVTIHSTTGFK